MRKVLPLFTAFVFLFVLVGCTEKTTTTTTTTTTVSTTTTEPDLSPVFVGVDDVTITKGDDDFVLLEGITITDDKDSDLINSVVVTGEVNIEAAGEYPITLTVTDSGGNEVSASFTVTVELSQEEIKVLADIEALSITTDSDGNYVLPTTGSVNGSTIIWTTDRPDVITKKGFVIKPGIGVDPITVTLTANFKNGTFRTAVPFTYVIEGHDELNAVTSSVMLPFEGTSTEYVVPNQDEVEIFFVDNLALPYIDVETFINLINGAIDSSIIDVTPVGTDQLRVEYSVEYEDFDSSMVTETYWALIDFTENTFTVNNFSFFENYVAETSSDYGEGLNYVDAYYVDGNEVTIPLGFYNFDLLTYERGEDDYYLMPLHVANLLFAGGLYYDVYYNGDKLWGIDTFTISGPDEEGLALLDQIRTSSYNSLTAPEEIRWATYNFLALSIDYFYGLRDRYDVDSYYELLSTHAEAMIEGSDQYLYQKVFNVAYGMDDLHTSHVFTGYYEAPFDITLYLNDLGPKTVEFYNGLWAVQDLLEAKYGTSDEESLPSLTLLDNDTIAVVHIYGFDIETPNEFKEIMDGLPTTVVDVVIDLSYNTGGNLGAVLRIFGYMTENPIMYHSQNPADGAAVSYYIESDYVAYDYNWYILASSVTFSAANLMTSIAKEQGIATVIGKDSSGGASSIGAIYSPDGSCLLISTNNVLSTRVGTEEEGYEYISIEDGIEVEYQLFNVASDTNLIQVIRSIPTEE